MRTNREAARVRIIDSLKDSAPWPSSAVVKAYPFAGSDYPPLEMPEHMHLHPRVRYIVFPIGNDRRDQTVTKDSPIALGRCGVWNDTTENRSEFESGFAQNDNLRGPELR